MSPTSTITTPLVNFTEFNPEPHVETVLKLATALANGNPIASWHLLESILLQSRRSKSAAFSKLAEFFPDFKERKFGTSVSSVDLNAMALEPALYNSYTRSEKFFREGKNLWGRDLVTMAILTLSDPGLLDFVKQSNRSLEFIQDEWFDFVCTTKGHRTPETWALWWRAASVPLPSERTSQKSSSVQSNVGQLNKAPRSKNQAVKEEKSPDIFMLYNHRDERIVERVNQEVRSWGVTTYFWNMDMGFGDDWLEKETRFIQEAKLIMVFLGQFGWGPTQEKLGEEAVRLEKNILPVLIGRPDDRNELLKVSAIFQNLRYADLTTITPTSLDELHKGITSRILHAKDESPVDTSDYDEVVSTLMHGNEAERAAVLNQIKNSDNFNRQRLSARLREEIKVRFTPDMEKNPGSSLRPPGDISTIRSWMISSLIWCDGEDKANRDLFLQHLDQGFETSETVRYWTLAGLYQKKVSYLSQAVQIAMSDKQTAVPLLARAIQSPSDTTLQEEFKGLLFSSNFNDTWSVLRVLRILPLPELAETVCNVLMSKADHEPLAYDSFYALASREMATKASEFLKVNPGTDKIVVRLINVLSDANLNGRRNLSLILFCFDQDEVSKALALAMQNPDQRIVATQVRRILDEAYKESSNIGEVSQPGFHSDTIDVKDDSLGIEQDVKTLTSVMLSKNVDLPLAIGLFGDWGHGKSFFIQAMKAEVNDARKKYGADKFYTDVVQIEFNAWHYVDTSLWASLVSYILSELSSYVSPAQSFEQQHQAFLNELKSTQAIIVETTAQQQIVQENIKTKQKQLQKYQKEREQKEIKLKELRPEDVYDILEENEKEEIDKILEGLGIPAAVKSASDLEQVSKDMLSTAGRAQALFFSLLQSRNRNIILIILALVIVVIPFVTEWLTDGSKNDAFVKMGALITKAVSVVGGIIVVAKKALGTINSGISKIEEIKTRAEKTLAEKRMNPSKEELDIQEEINALNSREKETQLVISSSAQRVAELEERIRLLQEERSLNRFLTERAQSDDYRKHLGIISTIRQDFNALTTRLSNAYVTNPTFKKVDRIILYIDDLDRCPVDKVMQVLQAVYLLLAFPLFVVVVGVDPRWLLHSLSLSLTAFQNEGKNFNNDKETQEAWLTTPQNFLEKIFQIQFCLKPMSPDGYGMLIGKLLKNSEKTKGSHVNGQSSPVPAPEKNTAAETSDSVKETATQDSDPGKHKDVNQNVLAQDQNRVQENDQKSKEGTQANVTDARNEKDAVHENQPIANDSLDKPETQAERKEKFTINEESLMIKEWEIKFAEKLFEIIPSPRAAGRFSNVYRLLKAGVLKKDLADFEGTQELSGDFQVPMLLLALITGASKETVMLFPAIKGQILSGNNITKALSSIYASARDNRSYSLLIEKVMRVVNQKSFPEDTRLFLYWIPKVARFSFDLSRIVKEDEDTKMNSKLAPMGLGREQH